MPALAAIGACTVQGRRPTNEDAETALASMHAELPDHALLAVFDGHGGVLAAKIAERSLLATLRLQPDYQTYRQQQADGRDPTLLGAASCRVPRRVPESRTLAVRLRFRVLAAGPPRERGPSMFGRCVPGASLRPEDPEPCGWAPSGPC